MNKSLENYGPLEYCIVPIDLNSLLWIFQRGISFDFHEVASRINDPPLAFMLKDILRAKAMVTQTL